MSRRMCPGLRSRAMVFMSWSPKRTTRIHGAFLFSEPLMKRQLVALYLGGVGRCIIAPRFLVNRS
jgi:hypothetical protein